jgi:hypothetical protein
LKLENMHIIQKKNVFFVHIITKKIKMVYRSRKHRKHGRKAHRGTRRIRGGDIVSDIGQTLGIMFSGAGQFSGGSRRRHHRMKGGTQPVIVAV